MLTYEESHKEIDGELFKLCNCHDTFFPNEEGWFPCNLENFYKNNRSPDKLYPYCKKCTMEKSKLWRSNNTDKVKISQYKYDHSERKSKALKENSIRQRESGYRKTWEQNNKDKIKAYREVYSNKIHKISKQEWISCKKYFNNCCAYCGLPIEEHDNKVVGELKHTDFHKEHVNCNGSDGLDNCIPSCKRCNTSKHTENMEEWYKRQEFFSEDKLNKIHMWLNEDYKDYIQEHKLRKNTIHIENISQLDI